MLPLIEPEACRKYRPLTLRLVQQVQDERAAEQVVCVGAEWHRFPSAFFLPGSAYRLAFLPSGFGGLLPRPFNTSEVGKLLAQR